LGDTNIQTIAEEFKLGSERVVFVFWEDQGTACGRCLGGITGKAGRKGRVLGWVTQVGHGQMPTVAGRGS
jgi:hypothetical protein